MPHHTQVDSSRLASLVSRGLHEGDQAYIVDALSSFVNEAWLMIEDEDFHALQRSASHLSSCARVLGHDFIGDVAGMLAVSASEAEAERCHLFLAVIQREWDTVTG